MIEAIALVLVALILSPLYLFFKRSERKAKSRFFLTLNIAAFFGLCLLVFGVASIREFALPIMIGVIAGGYSSIFLAGSFLYIFSVKPQTATAPAQAAKIPAAPKPAVAKVPAATATNVSQAAGAKNNVRQLSSTRRKKKRR